MYTSLTVLAVNLTYIGLLFAVALWVERKTPLSRRLFDTPLVYSLALAVYCTSWTYYGSVGTAVTSGMLFLTIYIGPTLAAVIWWLLLRRMVWIKKHFRVTSVADFISVRYGKSQAVAALVTVAAWLGTMPYVALQLKSVVVTFGVITRPGAGPVSGFIATHFGPLTVVFMSAFTILFGARRLDPTERHQGMTAAVAVESLVKLVVFVCLGLFAVAGFLDGPEGMVRTAHNLPAAGRNLFTPAGANAHPYMLWATYLLLSTSAIIFLPRQFHIAVVENSRENDIRTAQWVFPLYTLLISIFVIPIAMAGISNGIPLNMADTYVLRLPIQADRPLLALAVFLGGFSAATGMIMISAMTLSTMLTNHLLMPLFGTAWFLNPLRRHILKFRWASVVAVLGLGFVFYRLLGESYMLVNMGIISFAAAIQFAPAALLGMFWERGTRTGALLGLGGGFATWFYTLLIPALVKSGLIGQGLLESGPAGMAFLSPQGLFGLHGMDPLTHSVLVSMLVNVTLYVAGSLFFGRSRAEATMAQEFVRVFAQGRRVHKPESAEGVIDIGPKCDVLRKLFASYLPAREVEDAVERSLVRAGLAGRTRVSLPELAGLRSEVERFLAGAFGSAAAHHAVSGSGLITPAETRELSDIYASILADLKLPPEELKRKVDYHQEREALLQRQAQELEEVVAERTRDLAAKARELEEANSRLREVDRLKSAFLSSVSHELRTPLTSVLGFAKLIGKDFSKEFAHLAVDQKGREKARRILDNLDIIESEANRLTRLINDVLDLNRIESGRMQWRDAVVNPSLAAQRAADSVRGRFEEKPGVAFRVAVPDGLGPILADPDRFQQVLINLLDNAAKFTEHGEVRLLALQKAGMVEFRVSDTGPGIAPDNMEHIFTRFYQVGQGDTLEEKPRGTGLGLAISRQIVEHYGGSVQVRSVPGKGSTFIVIWPVLDQKPGTAIPEPPAEAAAPPAPAPGVSERTGESTQAGFSPCRILVVEDDPSTASFLTQTLENEGYLVRHAPDGFQAVETARVQPPDLITMDIMMPVMDGRQAIAVLRRDDHLAGIPIVAVSVLAESGEAGADAALGKPVDHDKLLETVEFLLHGSSCRRPCVALDDGGLPPVELAGLFVGPVARYDEAEFWERMDAGFAGTIIISSQRIDDPRVVELAGSGRVQMVVLPVREQ